ncbi:ATP-binding protein [Streptomyces tubercidicus]|uniref:ATP-binding protein n=1 Tax=Streptomyces tubercidicus TaxID=47759 RepID=UPI0034676DB0
MQPPLTPPRTGSRPDASFCLPETVRAPGTARQLLESVLADWLICSKCADSAQLLVSELVTNAVMHGCGPVQLSVTREWSSGEPCSLRIAVTDASPEPARRRQTASSDERGRGLAIVDMLADRWGQDVLGAGKRIWFEVGRFCH